MQLSHAYFRYLRMYIERCVCVFGTRMAMIDTLLTTIEQQAKDEARERGKRKERKTRELNGREEGGEGDHVKKSSSFVCQSFYDDTVVIRIYIHYRASECMTWMYLHFNSERACNLFCTIDLMM